MRRKFSAEFKFTVVCEALMLPSHRRIKPICRFYASLGIHITPVQLRKWIINHKRPKYTTDELQSVCGMILLGE